MKTATSTHIKAVAGSLDKPLRFGNILIPCYVLEDGRRVITELGMKRGVGVKGHKSLQTITTFFKTLNLTLSRLGSKTTTTFADQITFKRPDGPIATGYEATALIDICTAVVDAEAGGSLPKRYNHLVSNCYKVLVACAKVGIVALVDEATGFQDVRERDELQAILAAYIAPEFMPWSKVFPDEFFEELFRLKGWGLGGGSSSKRPKYIGKIVNDIVYKRLPKGVLEALRTANPADKTTGARSKRHHQALTEHTGLVHLKGHLGGLMGLMRACGSWKQFVQLLDRAYPVPSTPTQFAMEEIDRQASCN